MSANVISWITMVTGVGVQWLAGSHRFHLAWTLGILNQFVWGALAITTGQWGFLAGSVVYGAVYSRNLYRVFHPSRVSRGGGQH